MTFTRLIWIIARIICYAALALVIVGAASFFVPYWLELCSNQAGGTIRCTDPLYRTMAEFGFTVVMLSVFTGIPTLLSLGALIFAVVDVRRWLRS